jgi:hypothetical protein
MPVSPWQGRRSWDDIQLAAERLRCTDCGCEYFVTQAVADRAGKLAHKRPESLAGPKVLSGSYNRLSQNHFGGLRPPARSRPVHPSLGCWG